MRTHFFKSILILVLLASAPAQAGNYTLTVKHGLQLRETLWVILGDRLYQAANGDDLTRDLIQRLPETGDYQEVSAPMLLSLISRNSDVCRAFVEVQDKVKAASKEIEAWMDDTVLKFWNRYPDPLEKKLLLDLGAGVDDASLVKTMMCTAMLSSLQFIKN